MTIDEQYIARCLQLATLGAGNVAPNPMVGAVLVYQGAIIGEGYHKKYGEAHAEVNCIENVTTENRSLIHKSTLYVSLEPCSHYGKTPPCVELILNYQIKKVVIGCRDIYKEVDGNGIRRLRQGGVEVTLNVLEQQCVEINKRFFTFHTNKRPYIILKWAQSLNNKTGSYQEGRIYISNPHTNRVVHKWRSEEAAILVGTHTAMKDNPFLTTRLWSGNNPVRLVIDKSLRLPSSSHLYNREAPTILFNSLKNAAEGNIRYVRIGPDHFLKEMLGYLYEINIQSLLVEGGRATLQSFIDEGLWDQARVITNEELILADGPGIPSLQGNTLLKQESFSSDKIRYYQNRFA